MCIQPRPRVRTEASILLCTEADSLLRTEECRALSYKDVHNHAQSQMYGVIYAYMYRTGCTSEQDNNWRGRACVHDDQALSGSISQLQPALLRRGVAHNLPTESGAIDSKQGSSERDLRDVCHHREHELPAPDLQKGRGGD